MKTHDINTFVTSKGKGKPGCAPSGP